MKLARSIFEKVELGSYCKPHDYTPHIMLFLSIIDRLTINRGDEEVKDMLGSSQQSLTFFCDSFLKKIASAVSWDCFNKEELEVRVIMPFAFC